MADRAEKCVHAGIVNSVIQIRLVASVDDAKNCEEPDMPILASATWGQP
jgi:hypothetical protein